MAQPLRVERVPYSRRVTIENGTEYLLTRPVYLNPFEAIALARELLAAAGPIPGRHGVVELVRGLVEVAAPLFTADEAVALSARLLVAAQPAPAEPAPPQAASATRPMTVLVPPTKGRPAVGLPRPGRLLSPTDIPEIRVA